MQPDTVGCLILVGAENDPAPSHVSATFDHIYHQGPHRIVVASCCDHQHRRFKHSVQSLSCPAAATPDAQQQPPATAAQEPHNGRTGLDRHSRHAPRGEGKVPAWRAEAYKVCQPGINARDGRHIQHVLRLAFRNRDGRAYPRARERPCSDDASPGHSVQAHGVRAVLGRGGCHEREAQGCVRRGLGGIRRPSPRKYRSRRGICGRRCQRQQLAHCSGRLWLHDQSLQLAARRDDGWRKNLRGRIAVRWSSWSRNRRDYGLQWNGI
mmetsp:Transcript_10242/g.24162  ORF Transcript_10242/g.24162 Transcript_10242/m.24162 type:complete len:266 (+) Transcript_10242:163-960(+)